MGEQLDLFGYKPAKPAEPGAAVPDEEESLAHAASESLPGQMDLFGDRWQRAAAAHKALRAFDLDAAVEGLREAVRLYPTDTSLIERAELVTKLAKTLRGARRKAKSAARALAAIDWRSSLRACSSIAGWWRRSWLATMPSESRVVGR